MTSWRVGHYDDWPTLGWDLVDWLEAYLCHGPGDVQGDPIVLDDEEVQLILDLYRLHPKGHPREGRRVVSRGRYSRAKGRAKSEIAGMLCCAEAAAPVRFDGWAADGRPIGRPVTYPFIRCLATEEGQSGNTYDNVRVMLEHGIENHPDVFGGIDVGLTRVFLPDGGEIRPSTASSAAKDGGKETFVVADEVHLYVLPELKGMHRTVSRNLVKRKIAEPWLFETSTMFRPGQMSIGETGHHQAEAVRSGRRRPNGLYVNHREGTEVTDWSDDDQILRSLTESYGAAAPRMDLDRILHEEIRDTEAEEADSRRYFLNQEHKHGDAAFDPKLWAQLTDASRSISDGALVTLGFDGARYHDSTALVVVEVATGHMDLVDLWEEPTDGTVTDWSVPVNEVHNAVATAFERWDVWRLYADPPYWETDLAKWQGTYGDKRVIEWWTNREKPMAYAIRSWRTAMQAHDMTHSGNSDLTRHVGHARRRDTRMRDSEGRFLWVMAKDGQKSPRKIDAAMAACLAWEARMDAIAAGVTNREQDAGPPALVFGM